MNSPGLASLASLALFFGVTGSLSAADKPTDPSAGIRHSPAGAQKAPPAEEDGAACPCAATEAVEPAPANPKTGEARPEVKSAQAPDAEPRIKPPAKKREAKKHAEQGPGPVEEAAPPVAVGRARVLILGDSLGLCGFGKTLDNRLRKESEISAVYTYMACGTIPGSWLRTGALARAHTACGYWTIEGKNGEKPAEIQDTYGMQRGKKPDSHPVPKLESLLEEHRPDILIIQNGTNLLSLFSDGKTLIPARHGSQLTAYLTPFMQFLSEKAPTIKKVYWVAPPVSGRVTTEIQDFLLTRLEMFECPFLKVIDSRTLIKYPYRSTMPDKEHFIGKDMELWAEGVFEMVSKDLAAGLLRGPALAKDRLTATLPRVAAAKAGAAHQQERNSLVVKGKLVAKSEPLEVKKLLPYQESMVSYLYEVEQVVSGRYTEREIVVMHPAHIRLKPEPLDNYVIGDTFELELLDFDGSPWESIKRSEETGRLTLRPYIRKEDEARFPSLAR